MGFERLRPGTEALAEIGVSDGIGGYGYSYRPRDRDLLGLRNKAQQVRDGTAHFSKDELEKALAVLILGKD